MTPLLRVRGLTTRLAAAGRSHRILEGVSFDVRPGECVALAGESGCGKSMAALSILRLLPVAIAIESGEVLLDGEDLARAPPARLRDVRGGRVGMVFQDPSSALNPVMRVGDQVAEGVRRHRGASRSEAWDRALALLGELGVGDVSMRARQYPHELSGGLRQRVGLAIALAGEPSLLIADEPTTALDVTVQAQVMALLGRLRRERGLAILLVTHDLGLVAENCDRVVVMYAGQVVERATTPELFRSPRHPYTRGLLEAVRRGAGAPIPGGVPSFDALPAGCRFRDRCAIARDDCAQQSPALADAADEARCLFPGPSDGRA